MMMSQGRSSTMDNSTVTADPPSLIYLVGERDPTIELCHKLQFRQIHPRILPFLLARAIRSHDDLDAALLPLLAQSRWLL